MIWIEAVSEHSVVPKVKCLKTKDFDRLKPTETDAQFGMLVSIWKLYKSINPATQAWTSSCVYSEIFVYLNNIQQKNTYNWHVFNTLYLNGNGQIFDCDFVTQNAKCIVIQANIWHWCFQPDRRGMGRVGVIQGAV